MGYTGKYIRFRYTYSDHSLDFNIMGFKGSVNFRSKYKFIDKNLRIFVKSFVRKDKRYNLNFKY